MKERKVYGVTTDHAKPRPWFYYRCVLCNAILFGLDEDCNCKGVFEASPSERAVLTAVTPVTSLSAVRK